MARAIETITQLWLSNIRKAKEKRAEEYDRQAELGLRFYGEDHKWLFDEQIPEEKMLRLQAAGIDEVGPGFKMTVNRVFELTALYGPMLYNNNPVCSVNPRQYPPVPPQVWGDPRIADYINQQRATRAGQDQVTCTLLSNWLNYLPNETGMRVQVRKCITECLIKGMGAAFTSVYTPPGSQQKLVRMDWINTDRIVLDPDAKYEQDVRWIAIQCTGRISAVAKEYGLDRKYLLDRVKQKMHSTNKESAIEAGGHDRLDFVGGKTYDQMTYWKVFSKVGLGYEDSGDENVSAIVEKSGDFVYLVVAEGIDHPLNINPAAFRGLGSVEQVAEAMRQAVDWGVPHYYDNAWPVEFLRFYESPNKLYPISPIMPAIGEQMAIDYINSALISKLMVAGRTVVALGPDVDEATVDQIKHGGDYVVVHLNKGGSLQNNIQELNFGTFNPELYNVLRYQEENFEKRTGLGPMLYGSQGNRQIRTAAEGNALQQNLNIRPDDMREQVEDWVTRIFRRWALASRSAVTGRDVEPLMGRENAWLWDQYVRSTDYIRLTREFDYRIESGSTRKPNNDALVANLEQSSQMVMPILGNAVQWNPGNVTVLNSWMRKLARARGQAWGPEDEILPPLPPPPPPMPPEAGPGGPVPPVGPPGQGQEVPPEMMPPGQMPPPADQVMAMDDPISGMADFEGATIAPGIQGMPPLTPEELQLVLSASPEELAMLQSQLGQQIPMEGM